MTDNEIIKAFEDKVSLIGSMTSVYLDEKDGFDLYEVMTSILDLINRKNAEIERLQKQLGIVIKDFEDFAKVAPDNPFACKYCLYSVESGRACLWKSEHEDDGEACLGKHFKYKEMVGE